MELSLEPSLDGLLEQLDYSIEQLNLCAKEHDIICDRRHINLIAYLIIEENPTNHKGAEKYFKKLLG